MRRQFKLGLATACLSLLALATATAAHAAAPAVSTAAATHVSSTHVQLHGTVDPEGQATVYWFQYGAADCSSNPCAAVPADEEGEPPSSPSGKGTDPFYVAQFTPGLQPETTYHFRILAKNASGTTAGTDQTFTTQAPPAPPASCPNQALREEQHATYLPDCRAYEMASSPEKNGGNVIPMTGGTFAAADGSAAAFKSLSAFGDALGTNVSTEYVSMRSTAASSGGTGWSTHAVTPLQGSSTFSRLVQLLQPGYMGEPAPDLSAGVVRPASPLTEEPYVANVQNLYLRTDLRSAGAGSYELITACPRCVEKGTALPAANSPFAEFKARPVLAGLTPDGSNVIFESPLRLTPDTPAGVDVIQVFESDHGTVRLVDRLPTSDSASECDDLGGPACKAGPFAIGGFSTRSDIAPLGEGQQMPPRTISDGSDGHVRIFFTRPTQANGVTTTEGQAGFIYMREDGHYTVKLDASERSIADAYAPARLQEASPNGQRAFFTTKQALTDDAPIDDTTKLYMYDASKPGSDPENLTLLSVDSEPADGSSGNVIGVIGSGGQGHYVYFVASGQLVPGAPLLGDTYGVYLWHDGGLSFVASLGSFKIGGTEYGGQLIPALLPAPAESAPLSRVTPDGRHLLFYSNQKAVLGYDSDGHDEFYLYSADASNPTEPDLRCASCRPDGSAASASATNYSAAFRGGTRAGAHVNRALSADGSRVFFSTADALVAEDTNGFEDAYEYDANTEQVHLLSSGTAPAGSWFMDASADGSNVFIVTSQQLVGWDHDTSYDLYDVRVGGGFPEPEPVPAPCAGDTCQGAQARPPALAPIGSTVRGAGNPEPPAGCPKGWKKRGVRGKTRCVKPKKTKHRNHGHHQRREAALKGGGR